MNKIYIVGPDDVQNMDFGHKIFSEYQHLFGKYVLFSTEMIRPSQALQVYVVCNDNEDWIDFYSSQRFDNVTIVRSF